MIHRIRVLAAGIVLSAAAWGQNSDALFQAIRNNNLAALKGTDPNTRDRRDTTLLMYAAAYGSPEAVKLLLDAGADVNAKNAFDSTALHWAAAQPKKAAMLIAKGADVNAKTKQGRTTLMIAAANDESTETVKLMLAKGADPKVTAADGTTALLLASRTGNVESIRLIIAAGAQPVGDMARFTPLIEAAANCSLPAVQLLLTKGANPREANVFAGKVKFGDIQLVKLTALHVAAPFCSAEIVKALLDAGADVNARDVRGMTPLMLAVASETQDAAVTRTLLKAGADVNAKSAVGETALDWAKKFGNRDVIAALTGSGAREGTPYSPPQRGAVEPRPLKAAVERATALLTSGAVEFHKQSGCVGCHHQPAAVTAIAAARRNGAKVDEAAAGDLVKMMSTEAAGMQDRLFQRQDPGGSPDSQAFSILGLHAAQHPPDAVTDTLAVHSASMQRRDGTWHIGGVSRSPIEEGNIARTVRGILVLQSYAPPARKAEFDQRVARARDWLLAAKPETNDDFAMLLAGLHWTGASREKIRALGKTLIAAQRDDGGWAPNRNLLSDAYATGQTLWALNEAGVVRPSDPAYQKGVQYLLRTQWADGSWYVRSRAPKFQPYFQSGFPFDHDQWISSMATSWAVMALAPAIEPERRAGR